MIGTRLRNGLFLLALGFLLAAPCQAEGEGIAVIMHPQAALASIDQQALSVLYLGRARNSRELATLKPYEQPDKSKARAKFHWLLNGMKLSQLNTYWARLRFTGRTYPPDVLANDQAVIKMIKQNRDAIGYINESAVTDDIAVVHILKQ